jgi:hypothetical protein
MHNSFLIVEAHLWNSRKAAKKPLCVLAYIYAGQGREQDAVALRETLFV